MLKRRIKRRELEGARAVEMMADVRASIVALNDEDLLDLADIFRGDAKASLMTLAAAEMERRNLSL